jgi:hypothetical protein
MKKLLVTAALLFATVSARADVTLLLGICFWREGFETAFGPERTVQKWYQGGDELQLASEIALFPRPSKILV